MSWPVPSGSWNAGVPMTSNMNMGYTPDQWTLIQQQNWQQWAQWQQQYAQWQMQYGDKYTEQMQTVPAVGSGPPLPPVNCAPPPAPPPPDQPPPPHKNDRPLYTPKPPPPSNPPSNQDNINNTKPMDSNTQSWANAADSRNTSQNSEALKKLLEEERLFDIQFHKWEEEIEKWKAENVNHPDKQAYSEYEQKFEACRAQLLERRQQMKQKRARLTGMPPPALSNTSSINNVQLVPPPPLTPNPGNNCPPIDVQTQKPNINPDINYTRQSHNLEPNQYQHYEEAQHSYNSDNYGQVGLVHTNKSYENVDPYCYPSMEQSKFMPTNEASKGIPGLDLIPEDKLSNKSQDIIDITGEKIADKIGLHSQTPDYTTISKGINNILGDEKIMNILSMVCQKASDPVGNQFQSNVETANTYQYNNSDFGKRQNMSFNQGSNDSYNRGNGQFVQSPYNQVQKDLPIDQYYGNYSQNNIPPPPRNQINAMPLGHPLQSQPIQSNIDNYPSVLQEGRTVPDHPVLSTPPPVPRSKWIDQPMFTPSIIVEYEHKPLRLKARDFIEPVHIFEYNHKSKYGESKKKDFEREADELFVRHPRSSNVDNFPSDRMSRELYHRDYERRPREIVREPYRPRPPMRDVYDDKRRNDVRLDDWRCDDSDKFTRREDFYRDREKSRDEFKDRYKDYRRDENRNRSRSKEKENRKRDHSNDDDRNFTAKKGKESVENKEAVRAKHVVMIDDILEPPGREMRPKKIAIILRGLPGSGKSYLAKLIRDKEAEHGGTARIMSIDDYFMQEGEVEVSDPVTGKTIKKPSLKYEYEKHMEESYLNSLRRAFKRSITDGYFTFIIFDAVNESLKCYADVWNFSRQHGFQAYVCTMEADVATCYKRNIHNRTLEDIEQLKAKFFPTPMHHIQLDPTTLLQSAAITDVQMEDAEDAVTTEDAVEETEVENLFTSKWEKMDDAVKLARLDGTSKPLRPSQLSMEDYLQIDEWKPNIAKPGKKTVRWADIEERRQQEKMRAIGFVVGQTDWNRMTDPTMGSSALTQTKYIERVRRT
ncbi:PREDICTED: uncharacterized protein LOC106121689 isoform X1 [Papilio xuthus]|uniref:YLP motif-containing protein 1 n=1 Tax=Papilio xuthus TaxID=66420 RepID=A0AAJ6ZI57_PAPXU|nr:PREDICTED: uncharacterized protein LOC106121689 isoform X1 [Papilio xuthus]